MTDVQLLTDHHERMCRIRLFEEKVAELRAAGNIVGSVHLSNGQEAIAVGACSALGPDDLVFATYRGHGWAHARGVPLEPMFAELMGRETGVNAGRGGSAYFTAADYGFYGENSIVGAGAPVATGAALAARFDGSGRVSICVFGDGAMNQGSVHEAMNFATAFDLPVIFVCENNKWSELTPIADMVRSDKLFERAAAYGMPGQRIDGNDPDVVADAVADALETARSGGGPSFIEAMTQRFVGHYIGDAEQYREPGELDAARADEPLVRMRRRLSEADVDTAELEQVEDRAREAVDTACAAALAAPPADTQRVLEHIYA